MHACQNFDQRGFPRPVFSDQAKNLSRFYRQLHLVKSYYTRKCFRTIPQFNNIFTHRPVTFSLLKNTLIKQKHPVDKGISTSLSHFRFLSCPQYYSR